MGLSPATVPSMTNFFAFSLFITVRFLFLSYPFLDLTGFGRDSYSDFRSRLILEAERVKFFRRFIFQRSLSNLNSLKVERKKHLMLKNLIRLRRLKRDRSWGCWRWSSPYS